MNMVEVTGVVVGVEGSVNWLLAVIVASVVILVFVALLAVLNGAIVITPVVVGIEPVVTCVIFRAVEIAEVAVVTPLGLLSRVIVVDLETLVTGLVALLTVVTGAVVTGAAAVIPDVPVVIVTSLGVVTLLK